MKPWDPPDHRLYPVLDDLLADWSAHARDVVRGRARARLALVAAKLRQRAISCRATRSRISGSTSSRTPRCATSRSSANGGDLSRLPVVLLADGTMLDAAVARGAGGEGRAADRAGAAVLRPGDHRRAVRPGLACAVYGASEGLKVVLIEQNAPGGQAGTSSMIENYLGFPERRDRRRSRAARGHAGQALRRRAARRPGRGRAQARRSLQSRHARPTATRSRAMR